MSDAPWAAALAYAVTGVRVDLPTSARPDPAATLQLLREGGHDPVALARTARAGGGPWPLPLPPELRAELPSLAQFAAALQQTVELLALDEARTPVARPLDADERRLLADRPPHWGRIG